MNPELQRLEEKIAYLERHVGEQDRVMLELAGLVERLRGDLAGLRERLATAAPREADPAAPAADRPPHY
ncbi:MAG: SlyX family protein [Opitutales bacterium]